MEADNYLEYSEQLGIKNIREHGQSGFGWWTWFCLEELDGLDSTPTREAFSQAQRFNAVHNFA